MHAPLKLGLILGLMLNLCAGVAGAQVYRWKDANGVTHFSDMPPAAAAASVEKMNDRPAQDDEALPNSPYGLPYEVALAASNHPVTLYATSQCAACDQGRTMLQTRGIPYVEKTVTNASDQAALRKAGGALLLPLLLIGNSKYTGFEQASWDSALTAANYPKQNMLRPDYQPPKPIPAAAGPAPTQSDSSAAQTQTTPTTQANDQRRPKLPALKAAPSFQF
jgi:glutaredoxin